MLPGSTGHVWSEVLTQQIIVALVSAEDASRFEAKSGTKERHIG